MNTRIWKGAMAVFCGLAVVTLGTTFTWTGDGADVDWDTTLNSQAACSNCYPDDNTDDATFPEETGGWGDVDLVTVTINNLTINESIDFGAASGTPTLTADSFSIQPASGGGEVVLTITGATISAN